MLSYSEQKYPTFPVSYGKTGTFKFWLLNRKSFSGDNSTSVSNDSNRWKGDDLWDARYVVISGIDSKNKIVYFSDPLKGNEQTLSLIG
jgi:hypothetical protein